MTGETPAAAATIDRPANVTRCPPPVGPAMHTDSGGMYRARRAQAGIPQKKHAIIAQRA
jgi:hypothetical protein